MLLQRDRWHWQETNSAYQHCRLACLRSQVLRIKRQGEKKGNPRANIKNIGHPRSIDTWSTRRVVSLAKSVKFAYGIGALLGVQGLQQKTRMWFVFRLLEKRGRLFVGPEKA